MVVESILGADLHLPREDKLPFSGQTVGGADPHYSCFRLDFQSSQCTLKVVVLERVFNQDERAILI